MINETTGTATASHERVWVLLGFCVRLLVLVRFFLIHDTIDFWGHGFELFATARSIATGHGLSSPFGGTTGPTAFLSPGYPILFAGVFLISGVGTKASAIVMMAMQCLISCATIVPAMRLARRLTDVRTANLCGAICAFSPPMLFSFEFFWDTCLTALLMTGAVALALSNLADWKRGAYAAVAGLMNTALLPTLVALEIWKAIKTRTFPTATLATFAVLFAIWPVRNIVVLKAPILLRSNAGFELWYGNHPGGDFPVSMHPVFNREERQRYEVLGEVGYMGEKSRLAQKYIMAHPGTFVVLSVKRVFSYWLGLTSGDTQYIPIAVLALTGLILLRPCGAVTLPLLVFPLPYYITHADARFRFPLDPLLAILAAYAITWMLGKTEPKDLQNALPVEQTSE